jgi:hypothetical protein
MHLCTTLAPNLPYYETSAVTGEGVNDMIQAALNLAVKNDFFHKKSKQKKISDGGSCLLQ